MNVAVINRQKARTVRVQALRKLTAFLLEKAGRRPGIQWGDMTVVLVDDAGSLEVNRAHLGHNYVTDVISFNYAPVPGEAEAGSSGEIVINVEQACRLGRRYGGPAHELALYLAHGCDHLSGGDDQTPVQRRQMRRRELRWVKDAKDAGLLA